MTKLLRSLLTAALVAVAVQCVTVGIIAANLPRVVGPPAISVNRNLRLPAVSKILINNRDGDIRVRTAETDEVLLDATVKAYARLGMEQEAVRQYIESTVIVSSEEDVLHVTTEPGQRPDMLDLQADYSILVPIGTDVQVDGANGNVWVSKDCGAVSIRGRNADVEVVEPRGPVVAESTNGRIRVLDAPRGATIRTVNGNVYAHMLGGDLDAATTNGVIVARVLDPSVKRCRLTSQNGGITVVLSDQCSASVDAVTERGTVSSAFLVDSTSGVQRRQRLRGTIGKGDTALQLDTLNGNIWIARNENEP